MDASGISFFSGLTDYAVLQRAPSHARVYGALGDGTKATISVSGAGTTYQVDATVEQNKWSALLRPEPAGGDFTITAVCSDCSNPAPATLRNVTFGDVWYCAGQS